MLSKSRIPVIAALLLTLGTHAAEQESAAPVIERPDFKPTTIKGFFVEQFGSGWEKRWKVSHATRQSDEGKEEKRYSGEWSVEESTVFPAIKGDKGLVLKTSAAHHGISALFPEPLDPAGKPLVVQYEVKLQDSLECGGAYLKLLTHSEDKALDQKEFDNVTPYTIMFGPDKCGPTNKVHFIFNHRSPKTGKVEEKHLRDGPAARITRLSTVYTLIVNPDNTFSILINNEQVISGNLLEDFEPPVNPPKEIDDPADEKPSDWVDEAMISDPSARKPDDWDEDAPIAIEDEEAEMPKDWLVDEPLKVPDEKAEMPADWDEEEDGEWVAPLVPNPKCSKVSGCGEWTRPMKPNPDYKGPWAAPMIDNPAYKGPWAPRKIPNPDFFEDKHPANFNKIRGVGFELWTLQNDILFDNIYIGHSAEDAKQLAEETWKVKNEIEKELQKAERPVYKAKPEIDFRDINAVIKFVRQQLEEFLTRARVDPISAIKSMPYVVGGVSAITVLIILMIGNIISLVLPKKPAAPAAPAKKSKPAKEGSNSSSSSKAEGEKSK